MTLEGWVFSPLLHFYFAFYIIERVRHKLDFYFSNQKREGE
jgi:hypothetical protein